MWRFWCIFLTNRKDKLSNIFWTKNLYPYFLGRCLQIQYSHKNNGDSLFFLQSTKYNADDIPSIAPDQIFCAQFTGDSFYYRARILEVVDSRNVRVLYIDFGNQEVIGVERLRILKKEFYLLPVQAFQCCLDGVQPANEVTWFQKDIAWLYQVVVLSLVVQKAISLIQD